MATIRAIEGRSVHQIQSGQVIIDLNSVVKELVENSLDAGAKSIEVRFKNNGLDSIEVQDNGKGIAPEDFESIALKHHTSKLSTYEDLTSLDTFGFRGEALSSLCALSKFHILTARAEDDAVGKRLDFEISGKLKSTAVAAAQRGTTVTVDELFYSLPVRRKELEKNVKRDVGVRFSVSNQMPKGKRVAVFSTKSNTTTKENIVNVFGAKTLLALSKLDLHLDMEPSKGPSTQGARNWTTQAVDRSMTVEVQGHISRPVFGEGRQAPDRQMFFVNSRPCQLPQVSKSINEVYKSFNVSQSPFIFANLVMDTNAYDVNVSPDKRTIMLHEQTALLEALKTALTDMFDQTDHTVPQSTLPNRKLPAYKPPMLSRRSTIENHTGEEDDEADEPESELEDDQDQSKSALAVTSHVKHLPKPAVDGSPPNLLQGWLGRDSEARSKFKPPKQINGAVSRDKYELINHMRQQSDSETMNGGDLDRDVAVNLSADDDKTPSISPPTADSGVEVQKHDHQHAQPPHARALKRDFVPDPMSTPYDDLFSQRPTRVPGAAQPADDSFADAGDAASQEGSLSVDEMQPPATERPGIPAITPASQKATPGAVQSAFDRMRSRRTPLQTAEITVGDTTTTAVIGSRSPMYKKRRIHAPVNSQAIAGFGASPLLARGLRNFAAPGSQMEVDSSDMQELAQESRIASESDESESDPGNASKELVVANGVLNPAVGDAEDRTLSVGLHDERASDPPDELLPYAVDEDDADEDYIDEAEKRMQEDVKVARLIQDAEDASARPTEDNIRRASQVLKNGGNRKDATLQLVHVLHTSLVDIERRATVLQSSAEMDIDGIRDTDQKVVKDELDDTNPESMLSLTVSKADFDRMIIVGQFNLGFILAIRPASGDQDQDELFIVDQHAADEKYNYERLQRTVTLQSQRLVRPKPLELTAVEEEVVLSNTDALKANGFEVEVMSDIADDESSGRQLRLLTLPISGQKTFELSDLDELLHLLSEAPTGGSEIPRPKKVQRMLAMRACRSSIMVGKTLAAKQMQKVVKHMGEMERPWNCPHGRPTMRHLAGLGAWSGWQEGDSVDAEESVFGGAQVGRRTDWKQWLRERKRDGEA
ncbi:ATP-binding mismatch repair protein [Teratosphaeriaceae sp. CCFEE 6253]|nr:ATP-binding mismatch repair protein [Teratosphaeriaceae sp. CCFEE 6253]